MNNSIVVDDGHNAHDHSIFVDMHQNNTMQATTKNSARTGYHFYKNSSIQNSGLKNKRG